MDRRVPVQFMRSDRKSAPPSFTSRTPSTRVARVHPLRVAVSGRTVFELRFEPTPSPRAFTCNRTAARVGPLDPVHRDIRIIGIVTSGPGQRLLVRQTVAEFNPSARVALVTVNRARWRGRGTFY